MSFLTDLIQAIRAIFEPQPISEPVIEPPPDPNSIFTNSPTVSPVPPTPSFDSIRPNFPARSSYTTGSQFAAAQLSTPIATREAAVLKELLAGNFPDAFKVFAPVTISQGTNIITYFVMPDYLAVGTDEDFLRVSIEAKTAQKVADAFDCSLPTAKMVTDTWKAAKFKLEPKPRGAPYDQSMNYTQAFVESNARIQQQFKDQNIPVGGFVSGIKKDVVLTNQLAPNNPNQRVAIFGWYEPNGKPIQQLQAKVHQVDYCDYSQCIRLVSNTVLVNSKSMKLQDVFADAELSKLVSDEGCLKFLRY